MRRRTGISDEFGPAEAATAVRDFGWSLGADRCFLYVRHPATRTGRIAACWRRTAGTPDLPEHDYEILLPEPDYLHTGDPMFTAALAGHPATYIDDIEAAGDLVNVELERSFRHRALVHINLSDNDGLWGILQPAMSFQPRVWSVGDRHLVEITRAALTPRVAASMREGPWPHEAVRLVGETVATR